jgi:hypothetical protein
MPWSGQLRCCLVSGVRYIGHHAACRHPPSDPDQVRHQVGGDQGGRLLCRHSRPESGVLTGNRVKPRFSARYALTPTDPKIAAAQPGGVAKPELPGGASAISMTRCGRRAWRVLKRPDGPSPRYHGAALARQKCAETGQAGRATGARGRSLAGQPAQAQGSGAGTGKAEAGVSGV